MESTGVPGRIQVTRETVDRLAGEFEFERRGVVDVKGKAKLRHGSCSGRARPEILVDPCPGAPYRRPDA